MTSSTSHSDGIVPLRAVFLLLVGIATWAATAAYSLWFNPENHFVAHVSTLQRNWAERITGPKTVIFGGSSTLFAIRPEQLKEEFSMDAVNSGVMAGLGPTVQTLNALEVCKKGDTLVVAVEAGLLTASLETTSTAVQFSYIAGHPEWVRTDLLGQEGRSPLSALLALRPGSYHTLTMVGKVVKRMPLYRYSSADVSDSGWMQTAVRMPLKGPPMHSGELSPSARALLGSLRNEADVRGIRIAYSLSWAFCPAEEVAGFQKVNAKYLEQVAEFMPVLADARLGAVSDPELFSDTALHLNVEGSRLRTRALGTALRDWHVWRKDDIARLQSLEPNR